MKNQITIAKPDASRSCHFCKWSLPPFKPEGDYWCTKFENIAKCSQAIECDQYRDTRRTSQVISAGGKVFD